MAARADRPRERKPAMWIALSACMLLAAGVARFVIMPKKPEMLAPRCPGDMVPITGGTFRFGGDVEVSVASFCLEASEVSTDAYAKCVASGSCQVPSHDEPTCNWGRPGKGSHPINCVSWEQARAYCRWLGRALPKEREWEYAARGGAEERDYPWGDELATDKLTCWNRARSQLGTCAGNEHPSFAYALRDMAGNVSEWLEDQDPAAPQKLAIYDQPIRSEHRITRGGSWSVADPMLLQGKLRTFRDPHFRRSNVGMRCALKADAE